MDPDLSVSREEFAHTGGHLRSDRNASMSGFSVAWPYKTNALCQNSAQTPYKSWFELSMEYMTLSCVEFISREIKIAIDLSSGGVGGFLLELFAIAKSETLCRFSPVIRSFSTVVIAAASPPTFRRRQRCWFGAMTVAAHLCVVMQKNPHISSSYIVTLIIFQSSSAQLAIII